MNLQAVLQKMGAVQETVTTLTADFVQRRTSPLLAEPSVSRGRFYFEAPDSVLWRYREPREMEVLIKDGVAITYRPEEKRAEKIEIGRMQRRVFRFLGASEPLETLRRYFSFTFRAPRDVGDYTLILTPETYQLRKRLSRVELVIDRDRYLPVAISYSDTGGDTTAYTFENITLNEPIPAATFSLDLPDDVDVVEVSGRSDEQ